MAIDAPAMYRASPLHAGTLKVIDHAIEQLQPANLRTDEVVVTGEGEGTCIVLMPHHQLGGVALIVWSDSKGVQLRWGQVTTLRYHDEIDLAKAVGERIATGEIDAMAEAISAEMRRLIDVQHRPQRVGKPRLECSVAIDDRRRVIGRLPLASEARFEGVLTTSLAEGSLPVEVAVPAKRLR